MICNVNGIIQHLNETHFIMKDYKNNEVLVKRNGVTANFAQGDRASFACKIDNYTTADGIIHLECVPTRAIPYNSYHRHYINATFLVSESQSQGNHIVKLILVSENKDLDIVDVVTVVALELKQMSYQPYTLRAGDNLQVEGTPIFSSRDNIRRIGIMLLIHKASLK